MLRRTGINQISKKRRAKLAAAGIVHPTSTLVPARKPAMAAAKKPAFTGPKRSVCDLVDVRSGGLCEWPQCTQRGTDRHHRLNRKMGGRKGAAKATVNGTAWLLKVCTVHHAYVTSPVGERRAVARSMGWLLHENEDAARVAVWTRHHDQPVWLLADGSWLRFEEAGA